ncbi:MAG: hypothetical protein KF688_01005 [Pirellulales bacterium]|nr:hypothetical protein [Pirellulales bacterium]
MPNLARPFAATWRDQQLEIVLQRTLETAHTPLWIDRRVDRQRLVSLVVPDTSVAEALELIARETGSEAAAWNGVVCFGPPGAADEIATLALRLRDDLQRAPAAVRKQWLTPRAVSWPRLSESRALATEWLAPVGLTPATAELAPHDLLAAGKLPPLAAADRAVLLLAGFELALSADRAGRPVIGPVERPVRVTREYAVQARNRAAFDESLAELVATELAAVVPRGGAGQGSVVRVAATAAGHARLKTALRGAPGSAAASTSRPAAAPAERRYSLRLENQPLGSVLDQLVRQMNLHIKWTEPEQATALRAVRVSCTVEQATQQELIDAVLADARLQGEIHAGRLTIRPAERSDR